MIESPNLLRLASGMARHAAARQAVISTNVVNADTPGFQARDMNPRPAPRPFDLKSTRSGHIQSQASAAEAMVLRNQASDPNGNTVNLEDQVLRGIEASRHHDRALTVYKGALNIMRAALGRR